MKRAKYQLIKISVPSQNAEVSIEPESDKQYERITGIQHLCTDSAAIKATVFNKFNISQQEIFPEGFEVKLITTGTEVKPEDRFYQVDEPAAGSQLQIKYKDGGNAAGYPYDAFIYLRLENNSKQ